VYLRIGTLHRLPSFSVPRLLRATIPHPFRCLCSLSPPTKAWGHRHLSLRILHPIVISNTSIPQSRESTLYGLFKLALIVPGQVISLVSRWLCTSALPPESQMLLAHYFTDVRETTQYPSRYQALTAAVGTTRLGNGDGRGRACVTFWISVKDFNWSRLHRSNAVSPAHVILAVAS
jgi:hypothetical protein